ncbi:nuclear pore complex protein NUP205 isoform X2 [Ananas comosus]|uniref:Nuclear pore complex protein NUP205 isoform X2 n=1 Tax=Ananas comosus TaxID=4615 RepID=A0A6P5F4H3_ANACO|nr:nuclear pore complex protein NUP205 isoform X2 [Ananas comosus]
MVSPRELLSTIEDALLGPAPPTPTQRIELMHAIRSSLPALQSLLSYPGPKASDRAQVQSKEVRLPDSPPISLDDTDVKIALKLSDDLNLNEIECVRLLVDANREWILYGREPLEIFRLAAGLWYMERRDLITSLYILLRSVVLDQGLDGGLVADIQKHMEDLFSSGLRQRLIMLIKELNREEPAGVGHQNAERYVLDFRGALVERRAVVLRERLSLSHCLALSVLIIRMSPKDLKDVLSTLKDCAADVDENTTVQLQITFGVLFSLVIAFISDALRTSPDTASTLSSDASFRHEFHGLVMSAGNNTNIEGFVHVVRLAWAVHLMLTQDQSTMTDAPSSASSRDLANICSCLEVICSNNVFQFLLGNVIKTAAYQNDDEDMVYMYNGYLHKLMMCFVSHPLTREKVKEMKEKAMSALSPYISPRLDDFRDINNLKEGSPGSTQPFVSLLELVREIYQKEPELLHGNEELWTFVTTAGEDHTNIETLVAFLRLLSTLASNEEGASRVYELLNGKVFRSVGWSTLFDCLSIYEEKFKQALQSSGTMLPDFQEGDAKALVAYLDVLKKVVENGNPTERKKWFSDIEPLFKLLGYESVPPYLKGALRNAITAFVKVSPVQRDTIWSFLEQYDLPVVVAPSVSSGQHITTQIYDMRYELNEFEARRERYPSTISFLNLINALIAEERDVSDRGRRFVGIFRFVYDYVFGPFPQRAYADPCEKWQLVLACLEHFRLVLSMYDIKDEDIASAIDMKPSMPHASSVETQIPVLELLKDFMSGKIVFRNIMSIILLGVNTIINERTTQIYGILLERAVHLSLEIIVLVMERDLVLSDFWRPLYQPLDAILSQDHRHIVALLEYVRYDFLPQIQQCSIKIMSVLSSRIVGLVQLLLKADAAKSLVEDYATCLELRFDECQIIENTKDDVGVLILQLLIDNISRPAPNITHLLLRFDVDSSVDRTTLQPKFHYSCLKVILDNLEKLSKPNINALLHEFGFQLLYEICVDPLTSGPIMDLLSTKKYQCFSKHIETFAVAPLPKRNNNQALRISTLHQRAWLLKLLALELHLADMASSTHWETCLAILSHTFLQCAAERWSPNNLQTFEADPNLVRNRPINRKKVLELLEVIQFRSPDTSMKYPQLLSNLKYDAKVEDILRNPATSESGGIYYYSERGDRLIDLDALHEKLLQMSRELSSRLNEVEKAELRESFHHMLKWCWRYNKNLEEQAAQLHMLTGWSQIVEVAVSRRMSLLEDRSQLLFELLDASLSATVSPDCSVKMAVILTNVALTCMAKLRDERFLCPAGFDSDSVTCLDIISVKQLSNGACQSILFKLMMSILRSESSESLRRRQYALLLSYFQYCRSFLDPDVPPSVLRFLLSEEEDGEDELNLQKIDKEQDELARANFTIIRKEAQAIIDLITKDAVQGSEAGKAISFYVLDAFISIDHEKFFLSQLQSREILKSCMREISNLSLKDASGSLDSLQRFCTIEAQLSLLLRIGHNYGKHGSQILLSMGALEHLASCKVLALQSKGSSRLVSHNKSKDRAGETDKEKLLVSPILRLVSCLASLVDSSDFLEVNNKIVREVLEFVKENQAIFHHNLKGDISGADEFTLERVNLVVSILSKVWPYEEDDHYGFVHKLFTMMHSLFNMDAQPSNFMQSSDFLENQKRTELIMFRICFGLSSYLYFLIRKKLVTLQVLNSDGDLNRQPPTLESLLALLNSIAITLESAGEEKILLLNKIRDINELPRQDVDEIIKVCMRQDCISSSDDIRKRRYIAMIEMCHMVGNRDRLITLLLQLAECAINIILIHFQDDNTDPQDLSLFCGKLHPILERLEQFKEDKIGQNLKLFHRSLSTLKEMSIRKMAL